MSVLFIDLDNFKTFNDGMGHSAGDAAPPRRRRSGLSRSLRQDDLICRLGGDEFAVLVDPRSAERSGELARGATQRGPPRAVRDRRRTISVSASIGIASGCALTIDDLIRDADIAMFQAKSKGKGQAVTIPRRRWSTRRTTGSSSSSTSSTRSSTTSSVVHYQPVIDLARATMTGVEALVRWRPSRVGACVSPADFIPCAEESGHDRRRRAPGAARRPASRPSCGSPRRLGPLTLAVNLSARQLASASLLTDDVAGILESRPRRRRLARARGHRDDDHARRRGGVERPARPEGPRCPARHRRLRHGLLVAQLPSQAAGRHPQDRPLVRLGPPRLERLGGDRPLAHRARHDARPRAHRRGRGAPRAAGGPPSAALHARAGLPLRAADARRGPRGAAPRRRAGAPARSPPSCADAPGLGGVPVTLPAVARRCGS